MELYIDNSFCTVIGAPKEVIKLLYDKLSFYEPGFNFSDLYQRGLWDGKAHLFDRKTSSFPSGLFGKVAKLLRDASHPFVVKDVREKPTKLIKINKIRTVPKLRDYQREAVDALKLSSRGVLHLPPGTGKTRIALELVYEKKLRTLITCPTISITLQTYKIFRDAFGRKNVGVIYGGKKEYDKPITIACLASLANNKRLKYPVPQAFYDNVDMLIIDEFHHSSATTYQELNKKQFQNIYHRYGLTGTFFRDDGSDMRMHGILSNVLYEMSIRNSIDRGCLIQPKFFFYDIEIAGAGYHRFYDSYRSGIIENEYRNQVVIKCAEQNKNKYTLILVKEIAHGEFLEKSIPGAKFINGQSSGHENAKLIQDFKQRKFNPIIATTVIGEGTDIPCIDVIINAQGLKAEGFLLQRIGRGMRLAPDKTELLVFDFTDRDNSFLQKHANERIEVYRKHLTEEIEIV